MYNFIIFKCFDACIGNFSNKIIDVNEKKCVEECVHHLNTVPTAFQKTHSFQGFIPPEEVKSNITPGMFGRI